MSKRKRGATGNKWKWVIISVVIVVLLVPFGLYVALDRENKELNETTRTQLGGTYVTLSDGVTHYNWTALEKDRLSCWSTALLSPCGYGILRSGR